MQEVMHVPIVAFIASSGKNLSSVNRRSIDDFPVPESPIKSNLYVGSGTDIKRKCRMKGCPWLEFSIVYVCITVAHKLKFKALKN